MKRIPDKRLSATLTSADTGNRLTIPDDLDADARQLEMTLTCAMHVKSTLNRGMLTIRNLNDASRHSLSGVVSDRIDFPPELDIGINNSQGIPEPKLVQTNELFPQGFMLQETVRRGDAFVEVDSGEGDRVGRVFEGTGKPIDHRWHPSGDWFTTITITDGLTTQLSGVASVEFPPGARLYDVVNHIIRSMAFEPGNFTPANFKTAIQRDPNADVSFADFPLGFTVSGDAVDLLDDLLSIFQAEWWVDRGKFYIVKKGQPVDSPAIRVDAQDGMRIDPRPLADGGVLLWMDHRRDFLVGHKLQLETRRLGGGYRFEQVTHSLNNREGDWSTTAILRTPETIEGVF